jgi:hypothetical protein
MKIFYVLLLIFFHAHLGWAVLAPEDLQEIQSIYQSKISICEDRRDRAYSLLREVNDLKESQEERLREIFLLCGGDKMGMFSAMHKGLQTKLSQDVQIMQQNLETVSLWSAAEINPKDMIPAMLQDTRYAGSRRQDPSSDMPSTIPEIMDFEHYTPEKRAMAARAAESRADDHYCLKILCRSMEPKWLDEQFEPYLKGEPPRGPGDNQDWFFVGYFAVLKAYVFDLVENSPSPDHWYLRFAERNFLVLEANLKTLESRIAPVSLDLLKVQGLLQTAIEALKPTFQAKLSELQEQINDLEGQKKYVAQEKKRFKKVLPLLDRLRKEEDFALEQLRLLKKKEIKRGNFLEVKAKKEATERDEERRREKNRLKKEHQAAKKLAALTKRALERERVVTEVVLTSPATKDAPVLLDADVKLLPVQEEIPAVSSLALIPQSAASEGEKPQEEGEKHQEESDDLNPEIREEIRQAMMEIASYGRRYSQAAAGAAVPEVEQVTKIYLPANDFDIAKRFWTDRVLPWKSLARFFTRVLGASLQPHGGSIRNFTFPNGKLIVVHEPHPDSIVGASTLGRLRRLLQDYLGLSYDCFEPKS